MNTENNNPAATIRDGAIKATIWKNQGKKGGFYSVRITRAWKDKEGNYHYSRDFSNTELLIVSRIAGKVYDQVSQLRQSNIAENGGAS